MAVGGLTNVIGASLWFFFFLFRKLLAILWILFWTSICFCRTKFFPNSLRSVYGKSCCSLRRVYGKSCCRNDIKLEIIFFLLQVNHFMTNRFKINLFIFFTFVLIKFIFRPQTKMNKGSSSSSGEPFHDQ